MIDADGALLGIYRKSHIPDGPGYEEKFYFRPGDTGFRVFATKARRRSAWAICWDQWFPECARAIALGGADVLLYPTAIGSEPANPALDTRDRWRRAMVGHAVSNVIPVVAANRIGEEDGQLFYGSSFVAGTDGALLAEMGRDETGVRVVDARPRGDPAGAGLVGLLPRPAARALRRADDGRRTDLKGRRGRAAPRRRASRRQETTASS